MSDKLETFFTTNNGEEIPDAVLFGDTQDDFEETLVLLCQKYANQERHAARALCLASEILIKKCGECGECKLTQRTASMIAERLSAVPSEGPLTERLVEACRAAITRGVLTAPTEFAAHPDGPVPQGKRVLVECPARIDLCGGWSDTPPITYDVGGAVCNAAITLNGKYPIGVCARRIPDPVIRLRQRDQNKSLTKEDVLNGVGNPLVAGALSKCCLAAMGLVDEVLASDSLGGGLEITTWSDAPQGSGLGTSSILGCGICAALARVFGRAYTAASLVHLTLHVEQLLSTGGGWQDQVGGLVGGGFKYATSAGALPLSVGIETVRIPEGFAEAFDSHLVLVYTGHQRLAKNILWEVLRNWFRRSPEVTEVIARLKAGAARVAQCVAAGDLAGVAAGVEEYWALKRAIAGPSAEPDFVAGIRGKIAPYVLGSSLAGAGGGGFLVAFTKRAHDEECLKRVLAEEIEKGSVEVFPGALDMKGITTLVEIDN